MRIGSRIRKENLKNFLCDQRRSTCKIGAKEDGVAEEINITKEKLSISYRDDRKDASRTSQELARLPSPQVQWRRRESSFEKRPWAHPAYAQGWLGSCSSRFVLLWSVAQAFRGCRGHDPGGLVYCLCWPPTSASSVWRGSAVCRVLERGCHGGSQGDSKGRPGRPGRV